MPEPLQDFIRHARGKGLDHGTIRTLLLAAGWKEKAIAAAIASEGLDLPVPEPRGARGARDAFLYLLTFTSLYITVCSVIVLYYSYLDFLYPDVAWEDWYAELALDTIRYALSAVLIGFPLFAFLTAMLRGVDQASAESGQVHPTRRWLTYLTLFLAAAVILGDIITLLYFFLDGALTTRFVLKAVVLFVIFQVVLTYYFVAPVASSKDRHVSGSPAWLRPFLSIAGVLLVSGSLALGFAMAGSPVTARLQRLDEKRVGDLRAIHQAIQQMTTKRDNGTLKLTKPLPKTLEEIAEYQRTRQSGHRLDLLDPQTGESYLYEVTGEKTYELTATFVLPREKKSDLFWNHPAGQHRYKFKAESPP